MIPEQFMKQYESALATQSWQAVGPLMDDEVCVTFSNGRVFKGKSEVQGAYEANFALIQDEKYAMSDHHWVQKSDTFAVCLYVFHWSGLINGKEALGAGRGTAVLVFNEDKWQLLTEHLGPNG